MAEINERGCPCSKACCDDPDVGRMDHDEPEDENEFCEDCYASECLNCGRRCWCAL
jgi:hypothetical protein